MNDLQLKLANGKVKDLSNGKTLLVDKADLDGLYTDIKADEYKIPAGWILILVDGATKEVVMGTGDVWSEGIPLGPGPEPETP